MQRFRVSSFFDVCRTASGWGHSHKENHTVLADDFRRKQARAMEQYMGALLPLGLAASHATTKKMKEKFEKEGCKYSEIAKLSEELIGRLIDETTDKEFFSLLPREAEYFKNPRYGWEAAIERFPIGDDVEEASKCYALSRYPAAVFHSVQIVEYGLIDLGTFIKVTDPRSGWTAVANALHGIIQKPHKQRSSFERKNFAFIEQVQRGEIK